MRKYALLISGLALAFFLTGANTAATAADKIGFVDIREIMVTSSAGKKAAEDFKKVYEKSRAGITERENELRKLKDDLEKQRPLLTESAFKDKTSAYEKKYRDYQIMVKDANDDLQNKEQDLAKVLIPEILKVVHSIGEKEKFALVIDISAVPLAYYAKENDLTKRVTEEFNRTYKPRK